MTMEDGDAKDNYISYGYKHGYIRSLVFIVLVAFFIAMTLVILSCPREGEYA